jgi:hypothetical protein
MTQLLRQSHRAVDHGPPRAGIELAPIILRRRVLAGEMPEAEFAESVYRLEEYFRAFPGDAVTAWRAGQELTFTKQVCCAFFDVEVQSN